MAHEAGVRCAIGQVLMDQQSPPELVRPTDELIAQMRLSLSTGAMGRVEPAITPRFAITCSEQLLAEAGRLAKQTGAIVQTHLAETPEECLRVRELHGKPYTQVYADSGLLTRRSVLGHGIWLDDADREMLADREAIIAHCPTANTFLQSGTMDRAAHHAAGVRVALGSDIAGGPDVSMVRVARAMIDAAKSLEAELPGVPAPAECFAQITHVNADLLGWPHTSRLAAGAEADLLIVRPDVSWRDALDPLGTLLYAWDERWIEHVLVGGNVM
jgi:guanine deaminase